MEKGRAMKLLITTLTMIFISFGVNAHSFNGIYKCRFSSWSPFKTTVFVADFGKDYDKNGNLQYVFANVFIDGKKIDGERGRYFIKYDNKERIFIDLVHSTSIIRERNEGVTYNEFENKFSEKTGSKWKKIRKVFCEKQ
jgi:hypothetical protein